MLNKVSNRENISKYRLFILWKENCKYMRCLSHLKTMQWESGLAELWLDILHSLRLDDLNWIICLQSDRLFPFLQMASTLWISIFCVLTIYASAATIKRSIKINLTPKQQKIIVDHHNKLRRGEGSSDMQKLVRYTSVSRKNNALSDYSK